MTCCTGNGSAPSTGRVEVDYSIGKSHVYVPCTLCLCSVVYVKYGMYRYSWCNHPSQPVQADILLLELILLFDFLTIFLTFERLLFYFPSTD